jgi:hypothetical protein
MQGVAMGTDERESRASLQDLALRYANAGISVFPCVPGQKQPMTSSGLHDATADVERVRDCWSRWPDANLAAPTGTASLRPSGRVAGFDVLDLDVRPDGHGWEAFHTVRQAGLVDGWLRAVRTPSGGLHLHYPGTDQRNGSIRGRHLDFRGLGGYVLLPGSVIQSKHGAIPYHLIETRPGPGRPLDWTAVTELLNPRPAATPRLRDRSAARADDPTPWLAAHVARQAEGNRNNALFWAACRAVEAGVTDLHPLVDAAQSAGLDHRQAVATVRSAQRTSGSASPSRPPASRPQAALVPSR